MYRFLHRIVQKVLEVFMPGIAAALKAEGQFSLTDPSRSGEQDPSAYIDIEDNGADTTLITFAGMAVLYAAMPKFEFKKVLQEGGGHYNFIFVRDIYRSSYRLAPDGSADGIAFYERIISEAVQQLGAKHTIAIGMSGGAEAAFRISGASPIDRILAFNPAFPMEHYGSWSNIARVILNIRKLVGKPGAYFETLFVTLGTIYLHRRNLRLVGYEKPESPLRDYLRRA
ncbi:MAG: hypothetical protein KAH38_09145, partial [Candidatus Hydrogenedentes bacterium]|nr:hypothetical protein [Candidatus Hydrogenedentota bacterium]